MHKFQALVLMTALVICPPAFAVYSAVLSTPTFVVTIVASCGEGEVSCSDVTYTGVDKRTGASISLKGSDWTRPCPDRVTRCQHLGWQFLSGKVHYDVTDDGTLIVSKDDHPILQESGKWLER